MLSSPIHLPGWVFSVFRSVWNRLWADCMSGVISQNGSLSFLYRLWSEPSARTCGCRLHWCVIAVGRALLVTGWELEGSDREMPPVISWRLFISTCPAEGQQQSQPAVLCSVMQELRGQLYTPRLGAGSATRNKPKCWKGLRIWLSLLK